MNLQKIKTLKRFIVNSYDDNDLKHLFIWFNSEKGHGELNGVLDKDWKTFQYDGQTTDMDSEKIFESIQKGIHRGKVLRMQGHIKRLLPYAAVLAIIVVFTFVFVKKINNNSFSHELTSVVTENGQRTKVILPDSSVVWINSGTTLSYDYSQKNIRSVFIKGQGFFQVAHNENRPFMVQSGALRVKVLGTKFDVSAYPEDDDISVILESGSVLLTHNQYKLNYKLKPGEQADYNLIEKEIKIHTADIEKCTAWKDGMLIFKNDPMELVIDKLKRWYNIDIEVKNPEVYRSIFTGTIINESYQQIFRLIEYSCPLKCEIKESFNSKQIPKIIISSK